MFSLKCTLRLPQKPALSLSIITCKPHLTAVHGKLDL